jgi:hypothetical protein
VAAKKLAASTAALACLCLAGCVAPLMMAPAMLSSAMPAMTAMGASTAARSAMARQQQAATGNASQTKFEPFWAKKKEDDASQTATR